MPAGRPAYAVTRFAIYDELLDHGREVIAGRRAVERPRARVPGVGEPSLANDSGAEVGHVYRRPVHLDGNTVAIVQDGAVDGSHPSRAKDQGGHGYAKPSAHVLANPGIDVVAANRPEHSPLDIAHKLCIRTHSPVTHSWTTLANLPPGLNDGATFRVVSRRR